MMKKLILSFAVLSLFFYSEASAKELATFKAFYKKTVDVGWAMAVASSAITASGGTNAPLVAAWFVADVTFDYATAKVFNVYSYGKFVERSKAMAQLPLPENTSGSESYESALKILKNINKDESYFSNCNKAVIAKAIDEALRVETELSDDRAFQKQIVKELVKEDPETWGGADADKVADLIVKEETIKVNTLLALLHFCQDDYVSTKNYSSIALSHAKELGYVATLPEFIYAISSLYDAEVNVDDVTEKYFRPSIVNEPDNGLIPTMFAIYLDRVLYRIDSGMASQKSLYKILSVAEDKSVRKMLGVNYQMILSRCFSALEYNKLIIKTLSESENETIATSNETLDTMKYSLSLYTNDLSFAKHVVTNYIKLDDSSIKFILKHGNLTLNKEKSFGHYKDYEEAQAKLSTSVSNFARRQTVTTATQ